MNLVIKTLTPDLAADYFDFFENRAFTDNSPYRCYCQLYQMTEAQAKAACENIDMSDAGKVSRRIAQEQIDSGALQGYLAFVNDVSIGWCNANDKVNYPVESCNGERFQASIEKRERKHGKVVACFEIAPEFRGKGVATALLTRVCEDAKSEGYRIVEGFPNIHAERYEWDNCGPIRLYEKVGFVNVSRDSDKIVMRKAL